MNELFNQEQVRARKQHRCDWCGKKIEPGSRYDRMTGKTDGEFWCVKLHVCCEGDMRAAQSLVPYPEDCSIDELHDIWRDENA